MTPRTWRNPAGGPGFGTAHQNAMQALYGKPRSGVRTSGRLPRDWRERLPAPDVYYPVHIDHLGPPNAEGWAQGRCPFHGPDAHPSFSVRLTGARGLWRCFTCGLHGDLTSFHEQLTGLPFVDAVRDLIGGAR